ncbi:DUF6417 family protein [Streptomyces sp. NPDC051445]|uniref:DUF6417 family protein n=1 Tax=Streptomyces sp. NPDC051445 TaxID=3365653 RepID=UPI0037A90492
MGGSHDGVRGVVGLLLSAGRRGNVVGIWRGWPGGWGEGFGVGGVRDCGVLEALRVVWACEVEAEHGCVVDAVPGVRRCARFLAARALVETVGRETRAELSAWEGRPVSWAVRLAAGGHDLLAYDGARPDPVVSQPGPGEQRVGLVPSQMAALRVFVALTGRLKTAPAAGLAEQVRRAVYERGAGRWRLYLTQKQMESVAYAFWLHRLAGSAGGGQSLRPRLRRRVRPTGRRSRRLSLEVSAGRFACRRRGRGVRAGGAFMFFVKQVGRFCP